MWYMYVPVVYGIRLAVSASAFVYSFCVLVSPAALLLLSLFSCPWLPWVAHGGFPLGLFRPFAAVSLYVFPAGVFPGGLSWWLPAWSVSALPLLAFPGDLGCLPSGSCVGPVSRPDPGPPSFFLSNHSTQQD